MKRLTPTRIAGLTLALCVVSITLQARAVGVPNNVLRAVTAVLGNQSEPHVESLTSTTFPPDGELIAQEVAADHSTGTTRIKLLCVPKNRCLPFYAMVRRTDKIQKLAIAPVIRRSPPEVRAGDRGALVNNSSTMRITLPVTSLDSGRIGEIVRVRFERRLVWRARVIGPGSFIAVAEVH